MNFDSTEKEKIIDIVRKYDIGMLLLFGSRIIAKNIRPESDFDIAYFSRKELSLMEEAELIGDLMPIFKSDKIDLTNLKIANPLLRYEIARNCLLLYGEKSDFFEFKAFAFSGYINHLPLLELEDVLIKNRQKLFAESLYDR